MIIPNNLKEKALLQLPRWQYSGFPEEWKKGFYLGCVLIEVARVNNMLEGGFISDKFREWLFAGALNHPVLKEISDSADLDIEEFEKRSANNN